MTTTLERNMEYLAPERWRELHGELLVSTVNRVHRRVAFYRRAMEEAGVLPDHITSVEDLHRLPFTSREVLSRAYPYGFFAVPLRDVVRIHTFRSTGPNPLVLGQTRQDCLHRQALLQRFFHACGVVSDDIVQICLDSGMAGWGMELKEGAEALGALVIPPDPSGVEARIRVLADFKTSVLITTPSYGLHLLRRMEEAGVPLAGLSLRKVICVGEHLSPQARQALEEGLSVEVHTAYGVMELMGPAMAYDCGRHTGLHLALDHLIPEVVDPESGRPLPPGQEGELVITTLTNRANPLIRFRTGDITAIHTDPCPCGRTTWRMEPVVKRCDGLAVVRGVRFSPEAVDRLMAAALQGEPPASVVVLRREEHLTRVELWVAIDAAWFSGSLPELHRWCRRLETVLEEEIGLSFRVRPVERRTIAPYLNKGQRIVNL